MAEVIGHGQALDAPSVKGVAEKAHQAWFEARHVFQVAMRLKEDKFLSH
jgi:hypothetical protein